MLPVRLLHINAKAIDMHHDGNATFPTAKLQEFLLRVAQRALALIAAAAEASVRLDSEFRLTERLHGRIDTAVRAARSALTDVERLAREQLPAAARNGVSTLHGAARALASQVSGIQIISYTWLSITVCNV